MLKQRTLDRMTPPEGRPSRRAQSLFETLSVS
jgi:hypothetical protein